MTKHHHPQNKRERLQLEKRKREKEAGQDKAGRVRKRVYKEAYQEKEDYHEAAEYLEGRA